jgi:H+/Cl- antiporter ClcA
MLLITHKDNIKNFKISDKQIFDVLKATITMFFIQVLLTICLFYSIIISLEEFMPTYGDESEPNALALFTTKFLVSTAMHFFTLRYFNQAQKLFKYVNNHSNDFKYNNLIYILGMVEGLFALILELTNIIVLYSKKSVTFALGSYITSTIIAELNRMYFNSVVLSDEFNDLQH